MAKKANKTRPEPAEPPPTTEQPRDQFKGLPDDWPALIEEAERRGYLEFSGRKIKYKCGNTYEDNFNDPEEKVRAGLFAWLIIEKEYPATAIKIEVTVPRRTPSDKADIVVYRDTDTRTPYLVVEAKEPSATKAEFKQAIEQAFGNANSLRDTTLTLADSGKWSSLFQVSGHPHDERTENLLGTRDELPKSYGNISQFGIIAGDPENDIGKKPVKVVENLVRRAHGLIWAGGKRDPLTAFDEWCKLLFAKIYDERHTANTKPRRFQVGRGEQDVAAANRIREVYADAYREDPNVFNEKISLPDDKIAQVVKTIQHIAFTQMDVDSIGAAFEGFFGSIFRGELGQYFTRREIARFVCAMLNPTDRDKVLDPTAGSGGFLLETLIQVWHYIDEAYAGQQEQERKRYDFAHNNVYGIEIHDKLGRICQTNLILHKDGHTNIEVDRSCLDSSFTNPVLNPETPHFTVVVGNPPFGDTIEEGSRDHLGANRLANFELPAGNKASSEIVILERSIKWLVPGTGRLGMVVPDGMLNNSGEGSRCPAFRRFLFRNTRLLAIVSLPDYAFRKSGAQNKTSLLFVRRLSEAEKNQVDEAITRHQLDIIREQANGEPENGGQPALDDDWLDDEAEPDRETYYQAIGRALQEFDYPVFLAEAEQIGYTSAGGPSPHNELYRRDGFRVLGPADTILGQYREFERNRDLYDIHQKPDCMAINASELYTATDSHRIDPKYHIFKHSEEVTPSEGLDPFTIGQILIRRSTPIIPYDYPDTEFKTITLTQEGVLEPREAGQGNNPPDWHGAYFNEGAKWNEVRAGGILISRIDVWKGCIGLIPDDFDKAIVTNEFPAYYVRSEYANRVNIHYMKLLLRTSYYQRAIRAITTGHSNRRRTQESDFEALKVFLPPLEVQNLIERAIAKVEQEILAKGGELEAKIAVLDQLLLEQITMKRLEQLLR